MIRTNASLKGQAKAVLRANYWKMVLVAFIMLLIAGTGTAGQTGSAASTMSDNHHEYSYSYVYEDGEFFDGNYAYEEPHAYQPLPVRMLRGALRLLGVLGSTVIMLALFALNLFVLKPLIVGGQRFYLVSQHFPASLAELAYAFSNNYGTSVKTMFLRDLKILLWSLLFLIPGIVKSYEYRFVPYLLAECPEMDSKAVFAASADLMYGNKWRAFVLDLSFIGWELLSGLTLGLVGVFYVNPYRDLTCAAFYQSVCEEKGDLGGTQYEVL